MASLTHSRRALHQPFFSFPSSSSSSLPPAQPPTPSFPKYPFTTTTTTTTNSPPFFPFYPSPPPPPTPSLPTFPANISSLSLPSSSPSSSSHHRRAAAFLLPLLLSLLALLSLSLLLLLILHFRRRRRHHDLSTENPRSDSLRLFPPNSTASDGRKLSAAPAPATGTDFLYLGTLVNSRGRSDEGSSTAPAAESPYRKLGSPELRPLPPLAPHVHQQSCTTAKGRGASSPDEFYSPKDSPERKESSARPAPSPRWNLGAAVLEKCASRSSTASSPPSAAMLSPSLSSSPCLSSDKSTVSRPNGGGNAVQNIGFRPPPPPPPPRLPPPPRRTMTPSPPKRQPPPHPPSVILTPRSNGAHGVESVESSDSEEKSAEKPRPKLKPLHWDKVWASSNCTTVWDQLRSSSFQLNEEMIETLFVCNPANKTAGEAAGRHTTHSLNQESRVLDPKKSQNIAILLRALNVTKEEVCAALLQGNTDSLGNELLETLLKMAPSKEEELKLREYKDDSPFKLGPAENFLKAVLDIPFAFKRVDAMLYIASFDSEVKYLRESFETLSAACSELRSCRLFLKLLEAVLKTGNRMNVGTHRGDAQAFKLDTLLKLVDIKGTDGKTTLLHFVVQEIIKAEGSRLSAANPLTNMNQESTFRDDLHCKRLGLQVVSGIGAELSNVKKAAAMESEILSHNVLKLVGGIEKIRDVILMNDATGLRESSTQFRRAMHDFLTRAEEEIMKVEAQQKVAMSLVNEVTEYFHGNSAMKEAHPFRIFMVVRDFLSILDQVCKEIGKINERAVVTSTWRLPVPVNPMISPLFPEFHAFRPGSSDDESSSSSSSSSS